MQTYLSNTPTSRSAIAIKSLPQHGRLLSRAFSSRSHLLLDFTTHHSENRQVPHSTMRYADGPSLAVAPSAYVVDCVWVSWIGTTVPPFWAYWSVVGDYFVYLNSLCTLLVGMGAPLMLFCNGDKPWQCSQGYLVRSAMIM